MALTESSMLPLNTIAPDFALLDVISHEKRTLASLTSNKGTVIMFICNHCPFVKHVQKDLVKIAKVYQEKGIAFIAICSNDANKYPEDSPEKMKEVAKNLGYPFPYLYDETQEVARAYHAACTPDFFLFDRELKCVYRGEFDDSRPGNNIPVTGFELCRAMDNLLAGKPIDLVQKPSIGCNIKWK